jgi:hypothetical protein
MARQIGLCPQLLPSGSSSHFFAFTWLCCIPKGVAAIIACAAQTRQTRAAAGCGDQAILTWPRAHRLTRYFGKFDSEAEAKRWIAEHRWLTKQNLERQPDPPGTTDPTTPNGTFHSLCQRSRQIDGCRFCNAASQVAGSLARADVRYCQNQNVITPETGLIKAEVIVLSCGRRVGTAEGRITDQKGRLLAHGTTTCLIFQS